jgi:dihydrofolate reductase
VVDTKEMEGAMTNVLVRNFSISLDGYGAGPSQDVEHPLGIGGNLLHEWIFATRSGRQMIGADGGTEDIDDAFFAARDSGVGATIMGRNMFGPLRGPWGENEWSGWWGEEPPFHHSVFVLTHYPQPSIEMRGGTTFRFIDGGIEAALEAALDAAGERDVLVAGGASTIRQYLRAGLIDDMRLAMVPVLLGGGERLFEDLGPSAADYECVEHVCSPSVTHVRIQRSK